jgi:FAD:protein FMN transferase
MRFLVLSLWVCSGCQKTSAPATSPAAAVVQPDAATQAAPAAQLELNGKALGTTWSVKAAGLSVAQSADLEQTIAATLERINSGMSTWKKDSELSMFNADAKAGYRFKPETARVIDRALFIARATGGAFDPTVKPLVALWGFGAGASNREPTNDAIVAALDLVGHHKVSWTGQNTLAADRPGVEVDLSAIAKGYAVDAVADAVARAGATAALVEIGGEVVGFGAKPDGAAWKVGIDNPKDGAAPGTDLAGVATLRRHAMATSGDYRQFRTVDGKRISHTIDPRTGRPANTTVASATVFAPDCMTADAYATALMVLGPDEGLAIIDARPGLEALLLVRSTKGFEQRRSRGVETFIGTN